MAAAKRAFCSSTHCNTVQRTIKFENKHFSNFVHIPYYDVPKRHICSYSEDRISDTALLPRPRTRRNPNDWAPDKMLDKKYRSQSVGGIPKKYKNMKKNNCHSSRQLHRSENYSIQELHNSERTNRSSHRRKKHSSSNRASSNVSCSTYSGNEEESEIITGSSRRSIENKRGVGDNRSVGSIEEHEYLHFLLRITEDIIMNNYISNEDIQRVFQQHIAMNKHVLDEKKMEQHIANLAAELNLSDNELEVEKRSLEVGPSYVNILCLNATCECESPKSEFEGFLTFLDEEPDKEYFDDTVYYKHSLGRVTECTEPTTSSVTVVAKVSNQTFLDPSTTDYPMPTTKSEIVSASNEDPTEKDLHIREILSEVLITDKTSPEDSLQDIRENIEKACDCDLKESGKTYIIEQKEAMLRVSENEEKCIPITDIPLKIDRGTDTAFAEEIPKTADVNIQINLPPIKVYEQSIQTSPRLLSKKPTTFNRSTQSISMVSNQKCDTDDLDPYTVITRKDSIPEFNPKEEMSLKTSTELEKGLNTFLEQKLLGDDYDLTPERDTSEKCNFSMTDAATMCHPTKPLMGIVEEESLLLGDLYALDDQISLQRMLNNRETYVCRESFAYEDKGSSNSHHVDAFRGWLSDKTNLRYLNTKRFGKLESMFKVDSGTSTSSISVKT
ncbi:uncharacterized protein LOC130440729 isoform X1 [Diorhabda sublineata]|uniref:uncharacterized protein LOC130440729 isoform X1 n=1 Tax=Diorhabda sublineata TaxID=1163346 RepID=UPI0024E19047|nr:uncharacterized protein LOC130440729 isoform X1 [Diorhabda sublineata]